MTPPPTAHCGYRRDRPFEDHFSAFVFKIQANMNKAHRDRLAFMRICSGKFERGQEVLHVRTGKRWRSPRRSSSWRRTVRSWTRPMRAISSASLTRACSRLGTR